MPVISVIIPTYNRANFVLEAIQSVLAQTYTDYEIIVIDDGSTDQTKETLSHLLASGTIRYIHQDNQGEAAARNRGFVEARGKFITFLDSDDLLRPQSLARRVGYLDMHPEVGLVQSGFSKFDQFGNDLGYRDTSWFSGWIYPQILMHWSELMAVDAVMIPLHVLEHIGLFDESLHWAADLDLWRRIARRYPFGSIREDLARVRVHAGNISRNRAVAAEAFQVYLNKAFAEDHSLPAKFRRQVLAKMYAYAAYNLLGEGKKVEMELARKHAIQSMALWPFQVHAYLGIAASLLNARMRNRLIRQWRTQRFSAKDWN